jgi:hypothetical protein
VQNRIANGTLFPHISAKIQTAVEQLVQKVFVDVQLAVTSVLDLIVNDVEMALATSPSAQPTREVDDPEKRRRKADLLAEVRVLKDRHGVILDDISNLFKSV